MAAVHLKLLFLCLLCVTGLSTEANIEINGGQPDMALLSVAEAEAPVIDAADGVAPQNPARLTKLRNLGGAGRLKKFDTLKDLEKTKDDLLQASRLEKSETLEGLEKIKDDLKEKLRKLWRSLEKVDPKDYEKRAKIRERIEHNEGKLEKTKKKIEQEKEKQKEEDEQPPLPDPDLSLSMNYDYSGIHTVALPTRFLRRRQDHSLDLW